MVCEHASLQIVAWNVDRGLHKKLNEPEFLKFLANYDIIGLSECWVTSDTELDLCWLSNSYTVMSFPRSQGKGGGLVFKYIKLCYESL
jgi:hypothetical protein